MSPLAMPTGGAGGPGANVPGDGRPSGGPRTRLGAWSVAMSAAFVLLMAANSILLTPSGHPVFGALLVGTGLAGMLAEVVAALTALWALMRHHERSALVWLSLLPGLFVLIFAVGEFAVPRQAALALLRSGRSFGRSGRARRRCRCRSRGV